MGRSWILVSLLFFAAACEEKKAPPAPPAPSATTAASPSPTAAAPSSDKLPAFDPAQLVVFQPVPEGVDKPQIDEATKLGQALYFDPRLSRERDVSCATCHDFAKAGADGEATSIGTKKAKGKHNTPTVFNAGGAFAQGWDARATTMEEYVPIHVADASIMGMEDDKRIVAALSAVPTYVAAFKKAFPDEQPSLSAETFGRALGGYTKKLFARSRWDKYLAGDKSALNDAELAGVAMFISAGCTTCHQGKYIGATQSQKLGIAKPWPPPTGADLGRFETTKQEADRGMFKVPSLRNVTRTGPYLHDGSQTSLEETTKLMARHQVGKELTDGQAKAIVTFLGTLTGDPPKELTTKPR